jgi:hypothetical protein
LVYGSVITFGDTIDSPTGHSLEFQKYMMMLQAGVPVDPEQIIRASGVIGQDQAIEYIQQQKMMLEQQQQMAMQGQQAQPQQQISPEEQQMMQQAGMLDLEKKQLENQKLAVETEKAIKELNAPVHTEPPLIGGRNG